MPWAPLDIHYTELLALEEAGEADPFVFAVFPKLWTMAKAQAKGGEVSFTYRGLSSALCTTRETVGNAVLQMVSAGVITCQDRSDRGAVVKFDPDYWRRMNNAASQAESRRRKKADDGGV